jgi:hypothetical protein
MLIRIEISRSSSFTSSSGIGNGRAAGNVFYRVISILGKAKAQLHIGGANRTLTCRAVFHLPVIVKGLVLYFLVLLLT